MLTDGLGADAVRTAFTHLTALAARPTPPRVVVGVLRDTVDTAGVAGLVKTAALEWSAEWKCITVADDVEPMAIMLRSHKLKEEEVPATVRCIARCGAGTNNIPVARMTELGIPVFNTPGANANAVKELVLCALLLASRGLRVSKAQAEQIRGCGDMIQLDAWLQAALTVESVMALLSPPKPRRPRRA